MTCAAPILALRGVGKAFPSPSGDVRVLRGVDLEIHRGELVALTGPSGSGKTTLLNIASLLDRPSEGEVWFDGLDTARLAPPQLARLRQEKMGMVFQRFHLLTRRTALENVVFRFRYSRTPRRQARELARRALERVGMGDQAQRMARLLSGGEMQRVAVARALASPPLVLFADEPTGNLDAAHAQTIMDLFSDIRRDGIAILMATHNEALLASCSRHLSCANGHLRELGRPQ